MIEIYKNDCLVILKQLNNENRKFNCIIVDPPYNTGNPIGKNFKYKDNHEYQEWENLMRKSFSLANEMITENGIIFVNIDERVFELKLILDSIFGANNFIDNFIWIKNSTKNNSLTHSHNHEYVLCYAKNKKHIEKLNAKEKLNKNFFKKTKDGFDEIEEIKKKILLLNNFSIEEKREILEKEIRKFYKENPKMKGISHYKFVEVNKENGLDVFRISDVSAPSGKGAFYNIKHPNGKICKNPKGGYRYSKETLNEILKNNLFYFGKDEKTVPQFKRYLKDMEKEVFKSTFENFDEGVDDLRLILPNADFNNPKPVSLIKSFLDLLDISFEELKVLDFFAGSGTTVQACMEKSLDINVTAITNNENNIFDDITKPRIMKFIKNKNINSNIISFNEN